MSAQNVLKKMARKGLTIAFAESMTGGALSYEMVKHKGASSVLKASIVAYTIEQKNKLLGIDEKMLSDNQIVSEELAILMARSVQSLCLSSVAVGVTGNAGPTLQKYSQKKEAYIAIIYLDDVKTIHLTFDQISRVQAIKKAVQETYQMLDLLV